MNITLISNSYGTTAAPVIISSEVDMLVKYVPTPGAADDQLGTGSFPNGIPWRLAPMLTTPVPNPFASDGESGNNVPVPPAPPALPVLSVDFGSTASAVTINWTSAPSPDSYAVWKAVNGGTFVFVSSVAGSLRSYTDVDGMNDGDIWAYKVTAINSVGTSDFSNEVDVSNNLNLNSFSGVVAYPLLVMDVGNISIMFVAAVPFIEFDSLQKCSGSITIGPDFGRGTLTNVRFPALQAVAGFYVSNCVSLIELNLSGLTELTGDLSVTSCDFLTGASFNSSLVLPDSSNTLSFNGCRFSSGAILSFLDICVANNLATDTIDFSGGQNSWPYGSMVTDIEILMGNGCTVLYNDAPTLQTWSFVAAQTFATEILFGLNPAVAQVHLSKDGDLGPNGGGPGIPGSTTDISKWATGWIKDSVWLDGSVVSVTTLLPLSSIATAIDIDMGGGTIVNGNFYGVHTVVLPGTYAITILPDGHPVVTPI